MKKRFDEWNKIKKNLNDRDIEPKFFREREIWWCYLGANIKHEQDGKGLKFTRPVLILKKFSKDFCFAIPLSTQTLHGEYFFPLLSESNIIRTAILHQVRSIDGCRLAEKIDRISSLEQGFINEKITKLLQ